MSPRKKPAALATEVSHACEAAHGGLVAGVMKGMDGLLDLKLKKLASAVHDTGQAVEELLRAAKLDAESRAELRRSLEKIELRLTALERWRRDQAGAEPTAEPIGGA